MTYSNVKAKLNNLVKMTKRAEGNVIKLTNMMKSVHTLVTTATLFHDLMKTMKMVENGNL